MPIIRNLEEYYDNDLLQSIEGIVNGSTNYILTKTARENISYDDALKEAQEKGFAESNPILDTGGFDAKYKLLILLAHAFGHIAKPDDLLNVGIDQLGSAELNYAREKGLKIKLVRRRSRKLTDVFRRLCFRNSSTVKNDFTLLTMCLTAWSRRRVSPMSNFLSAKAQARILRHRQY